MHSENSNSREHGSRAFTLVELLTVIAIVGILAAIMIPVIGSARARAYDVHCKAALRQWGVAIQLFANDNKGRLPGPSSVVIEQGIDPVANRQSVATRVAPYIGATSVTGAKLPQAYICTGWLVATPDTSGPMFHCPGSPRLAGIGTVRPMGEPGVSTPMLINQLPNEINTTTGIAIQDMDGNLVNAAGQAAYGGRVPAGFTHGDHRNVLFWDWHVGASTQKL